MLQFGGYVFKRAETAEEMDQVHALNYRTFVTELAQYPDTGDPRLVDKFHHKSTYLIALRDNHLVGMMSFHGQAPFSIAERLPDPSILDQPGMRPLEVRLLAVENESRNTRVLIGLLWAFYLYAQENGITHLFISGVEERIPLYRQIGFEPIGPAVAGGKAVFVPMCVQVETIGQKKPRAVELLLKRSKADGPHGSLARLLSRFKKKDHGDDEESGEADVSGHSGHTLCLLPGPVAIPEHVHAAFRRPPIYHRGSEFIAIYERVREQLARLVHAPHSAILNGSGTLANEVIAATLSAEPRPTNGLLLVNGEFGQRLVRQAARFGLSFDVLSWPWGKPWDLAEVERRLSNADWRVDWVWGVHQESSTGVLNDLPGLVRIARRHDCRVCFDCISSLGAVPIDLTGVYLASGATGKSLGSYAGAALVFADPTELSHLDLSRVPSYLDLTATLRTVGPRYTFPSPTLVALEAALEAYSTPEKARATCERYRQLGCYVRDQLRDVGLPPLADEDCAAPVITSFTPPGDETNEAFVARCHFWGFAIGGASSYLLERRMVQIATMGDIHQRDLAPLFDHLRTTLQRPHSTRVHAVPVLSN